MISAVVLQSAQPPDYFSYINVFTSLLKNSHQAQFRHCLCCCRSLLQSAMDKVHETAQRQESDPSSRLQTPSESYWRDTWHRLSSALFPGHCCCCACASYQSSDTTCTLSPEGITEQVNMINQLPVVARQEWKEKRDNIHQFISKVVEMLRLSLTQFEAAIQLYFISQH